MMCRIKFLKSYGPWRTVVLKAESSKGFFSRDTALEKFYSPVAKYFGTCLKIRI
jgi:hypothetical protein